MISCTRRLHFDTAHRIVGHGGKCKYLHGHRYVLEASFVGEQELDELGRVIDFGEIKDVLSGWIDDNWDHNMVLWEKDADLGRYVESTTGQEIYYLPCNPTVENLVKYLWQEIVPTLFVGKSVSCCKLKLYETPNCFAEIS